MILAKYKDDFKENFKWSEPISIGKIDNNKEIMVAFYNSKRNKLNSGFKDIKNTYIKPVTILLRYGKNQRKAEEMAEKIQDFYDKRSFFIDEYQIYADVLYAEPIYLGTDENNIYEYSFEINFIENKNNKK